MQVFAPSLPPVVPINQHEIQIWLNIRIKIYLWSFYVVFKTSKITYNILNNKVIYLYYLVAQVCLYNVKYFQYFVFFFFLLKKPSRGSVSCIVLCFNTRNFKKWLSKHGNFIILHINSKFCIWDQQKRKPLGNKLGTLCYHNIYPPKILTHLILQSDNSHYRPSSNSKLLFTDFITHFSSIFLCSTETFFLVISGCILGLFLLTVSYSILFH